MSRLERDGGSLYYEAAGNGRPSIVFVHGLACTHEDWRKQVEYFGDRHRTVAVDLRGHGQSVDFATGFDIPTYGRDVAAVVAGLELEPALLVGHSMGCRVVMEAARAAPELVAGLVLLDGSRLGSGDPATAEKNARGAMETTGYRRLLQGLFEGMFTESSDGALRKAVVERALRLPEPVGTEIFCQMAAWDAGELEKALDELDLPLLVVQSTYVNEARNRVALNPGQSTPYVDTIRKGASHADVEILAGVGHFPMLEAADAVNSAISRFVATLE